MCQLDFRRCPHWLLSVTNSEGKMLKTQPVLLSEMKAATPLRRKKDKRKGSIAKPGYQIQVNGVLYDVSDTDPRTPLAPFLRFMLFLPGTKAMCFESACGCCAVLLEYDDPINPGKKIVKSVNSCLYPVGALLSLKNHQVITIEAVSSFKESLHTVQKRLADYHGSQCGFCSPGFVIQMLALLKNNQTPSVQEVEDVFDGNVCRCTGYRPILDAMKSFAKDSDPSLQGSLIDIEDLKICPMTNQPCDQKFTTGPVEGGNTLLYAKFGMKWYQPRTLEQLYDILEENPKELAKLINGDTSKGVYKGVYFDVNIDVKGIPELYEVTMGPDGLKVFSNVTLTSLIDYLKLYSDQSPSYNALAEHLLKIANKSVQNIAGWAGNLMLKWYHREFISDVFVIFEAVGAKLTIGNRNGRETYTPLEFLSVKMEGKVILCVEIPKLKENEAMNCYKVMPQTQNSQPYVSAGFWVQFKTSSGSKLVKSFSMVYTGISDNFMHASKTEEFLKGRDITCNETLQGALATLDKEVIPDDVSPLFAKPEYRKSLALGLFYKFFLSLLDESQVSPRNQSAICPLKRPVSTGKQIFSSREAIYPLTQPIPKLNSYKQACGEIEYINDIYPLSKELFSVFCLSKVGNATIDNIDITRAENWNGAVKVFLAKDIPGANTFMPPPFQVEEILSSGRVLYAGQPIALCVGVSQHYALEMVDVIDVTYKDQEPPIVTLDDAIEKNSFYPLPGKGLIVGDPADAISKSPHHIEGEVRAGEQYHFHMETQVCRCTPTEDGLDVQAASQWLDLAQQAVAGACGLPVKDVNITAKRLGGAYGAKVTRANLVACGSALAAHLLKRPVQCMMDLATNMKAVGKRHGYIFKYKVGFNDDGTLNGVIITYYCDNGSSPNDDEVSTYFGFSDNAYKCKNWHLIPIALKTNRAAHTWCRSPGSKPNIFVIETILEHVAKFLSLDPINVKQKNLYAQGDITPLGFDLPYCSIRDLYSTQLKKVDVTGRLQAIKKFNADNRWKKKGLAVVPLKYCLDWTEGFYLCTVSIFASDGSVIVTHGGVEIGQGINTKVAQVCAYVLGIPVDLISIKPTTAISSPNAGTTGRSITCELNCLGVKNCCEILKERLSPVKATLPPGTPWKDLVAACFKAKMNLTAQYWVSPDPNSKGVPQYYSYGVTVAEAELDVLTGENQINLVDMLFDCGESINPAIDIGQIEGAFVMGMGYWLMEKVIYDPDTGEVLNAGTWDYKPPFSKSIPINFNIELLKNAPNPMGVLRSKASGEPPQCMSCVTLFAVKRAIEAARQDIGKDFYFPLSGPATVNEIQANCLVDYKDFSI
ncbi:xanthine dehydrogenase/oxidase-like isoform X2 [Stegostoma tigrinum]|uniref:xanthine dehydrogenase/oxidase-like isoform X2 n=1 Tax=Stegostoma tigrinum TaxID=3053191 RepID=UPI00202B5FCA|nr:xanthine dehydrogenase/oxidase-like isoform X2 [Stegostoma tigrinum]